MPKSNVVFALFPATVEWCFTTDGMMVINAIYADQYAAEYPQEYKNHLAETAAAEVAF